MKRSPLYTAMIVIALVVGWLAHSSLNNVAKNTRTYPVRENSPKYQFINPLILLDNSGTEYRELDGLKEKVQDYIYQEVSSRRAERISFYFRDLNSSVWTGVNFDDQFVPASIMKVATVMVYLRLAEEDLGIMNQKLLYKKDPNRWQNYPPTSELEDGYYGIGRLISQSIIESDNTAAQVLFANKAKEHEDLYNALRLPYPHEVLTNFMSPKQVSNIFRALYGSTYLLHDYSEQVLELLTKTNFQKGIVQGVEPGVEVAHKFGEHMTYFKNDIKNPDHQLHDCGIVYYPDKPYFICIMTEGRRLEDLERVLGDISKITFAFVKDF